MTTWIIEQLTTAGYKLTKPRQKIISYVANHKGIFSVQDILREHPTLDRVSVYRTIDRLVLLDIVHPIANLNGIQFYELHGNTHHHHIVCTECSRSTCVDCDVPKIRVRGFRKIHHTFLLTGVCESCASKE